MPFFRRKFSLEEAARALRQEFARGVPAPLGPDLEEVARQLQPSQGAALSPPPPDPLPEFIDALPDPAAVLDKAGRIDRCNAALDALLGGRTTGRTLLEGTRSVALQEASVRASAGKRVQQELGLPAVQKTVLASLSPLPGGRVLVVLRDLTEGKKLEQSRRDFVANASHELRTPVAAISGAVQTLLSEGIHLSPDARGFVEMVERHALRLTRLTQDLLDLSRLESGEWRVEMGPIELQPVFESQLELVRSRAAGRGVQVLVDVPAGLRILGDRRALDQVLVNLLDNAIKFSPQGGRVTLLADGAGEQVLISVIDQGPGVEARHIQRIFERFYRVDGGRAREAREAGGTGLGLAIVKHLVGAQGGEVGVESGQGGSRFWVRLKAAP